MTSLTSQYDVINLSNMKPPAHSRKVSDGLVAGVSDVIVAGVSDGLVAGVSDVIVAGVVTA